MLSLHELKSELFGKQADTKTKEDESLSRFCAEAVWNARSTLGRPYCWRVDKIEKSGATLRIRSFGHGLSAGDTIKIVGSTTTPSVDATYTIASVYSENEIVVAFAGDSLSGGLVQRTAYLHPRRTIEFVPTGLQSLWVPAQVLPWQSIVSIEERIGQSEWETVESTEYSVGAPDDMGPARAVRLDRVTGTWPQWVRFIRGQHALPVRSRMKTLRIVYWAGASQMPSDLRTAVNSLVFDLYDMEGGGKDEESYSYEGATQRRLSGEERKSRELSTTRILRQYGIKTMRGQ